MSADAAMGAPKEATIEAVVLRYDRRRIGRLHAHVARDFCLDAARHLLQCPGPVVIGTGFYIAHAGKPETDGPPGALALCLALERLGRKVELVTDTLCAPMMRQLCGDRRLHVLTVDDDDRVRAEAKAILDYVAPGLLVAIERCGPSADRRFRQFDGTDITVFTGRMEHLFAHGVPSIGIVDGGNEIGIGAVSPVVAGLPGLPNQPCVTPTDRIVLGGIANWGTYGLIAALSQLAESRLLVTVEEEAGLRAATVAAGAVDGDSGEHITAVDGYPSELNGLVVERLHRLIDSRCRKG